MNVMNIKLLVGCSVMCAVLILMLLMFGQVNILSLLCVCGVSYAVYHNLG